MKPTQLTLQQANLLIAHYQVILEDWEIYSHYELPINHPIDEPFDNSDSIHFIRCSKENRNFSIEEVCLELNLPQPNQILNLP